MAAPHDGEFDVRSSSADEDMMNRKPLECKRTPSCMGTDFYRQMEPLTLSFNVFAISLKRTPYQCHERFGICDVFCGVYSTLMLLFLGINVTRWTAGLFDSISNSTLVALNGIPNVVWGLQNLCHFAAFYVQPYTCAYFQTFVIDYQTYQNFYKNKRVSIRRHVGTCVAVYWLVVLVYEAITLYYEYCYGNGQPIRLLYPLQTHNNNVWGQIVMVINSFVMFYLNGVWLGITVLIVVISVCLTLEFHTINKEISRAAQTDLNRLLNDLEQFRHRHLAVCKLTKSIDKLLSLHFALDLAASLLITCMMMYVIIWDDSVRKDTGAMMSIICWIIAGIGKILIECHFASTLNEAVSAEKLCSLP